MLAFSLPWRFELILRGKYPPPPLLYAFSELFFCESFVYIIRNKIKICYTSENVRPCFTLIQILYLIIKFHLSKVCLSIILRRQSSKAHKIFFKRWKFCSTEKFSVQELHLATKSPEKEALTSRNGCFYQHHKSYCLNSTLQLNLQVGRCYKRSQIIIFLSLYSSMLL